MSELLKKIERDALSLPPRERALLADKLLSSLDGPVPDDIEIAWIAEAERRYEEYLRGERKGIPAKEVFDEADQLLK